MTSSVTEATTSSKMAPEELSSLAEAIENRIRTELPWGSNVFRSKSKLFERLGLKRADVGGSVAGDTISVRYSLFDKLISETEGLEIRYPDLSEDPSYTRMRVDLVVF